MKHFEEFKIAVTASLFCVVMLLVYAVFPKDGLAETTKARMPEIPSAESFSEEDYGFQIYTQDSNYDYSYDEDSFSDDSYSDGSYSGDTGDSSY